MSSYTVKSGDTLSGVASQFGMTVDELVNLNQLIQVGQVLKPGVGVVTPPPANTDSFPVGTWLWFENVGLTTVNNSNLIVQRALAMTVGLDYSSGPGIFGPMTKAAYQKWQETLFGPGPDSDGIPAKTSLEALGKKTGFEVRYMPVPAGAAGEPPADYSRTYINGKTVNQRTKVMIQIAEGYAKSMGVPTPFYLSQGSYNLGVSASAGTHDGGGVMDISVDEMNTSQRYNTIKALRMAGFASWLRTPDEGFAYHIHSNAIGDKEMSSAGKDQLTQYYNGQNGLAGHGGDTAPSSVGRPAPAWVRKYTSSTKLTIMPAPATLVNIQVDTGEILPVVEPGTTVVSPVPGYQVTYPFGVMNPAYQSGFHNGDDYAAPVGKPVIAVRDGVIAWANNGGGDYGTWMGLRADNGRDYVYCHLSEFHPLVSIGAPVKAGQIVGYVGQTGNVTGAHLHLEDRPAGGGYGTGRKPLW